MTNLPLNTELNLFVTHMDADGPLLRIWAQVNKEDVAGIERLMHPLTPQFDNGLGCLMPQSRPIVPNVICCAMFERGYYRARTLSLHHTGGIVVQFIDYGNTEILKISDIRLLDGIAEATELQRVPPLAVDFIVANVLPRGRTWEGQTLGGIFKNIRYNDCPGKIVRVVGKYRLLRMLFEGRDLAEILVEQNLATISCPEEMFRFHAHFQQSLIQQSQVPKSMMQIPMQPAPLEVPLKKYQTMLPSNPLRVPRTQHYQESWRMQTQPNSPPTNISSAKVHSPHPSDDSGVFRSRILEIGSKHEVKVSYVEDGPLMFSVQVNSTLAELNGLMYHINHSHTPQPLIEPPVIGSVCLGRYTIDKSLLRAVVMQVREHDCKLHYVDFGHIETLPYTDIYQLPRQYINPRILSIRFTMSNVNEIRINDEMKEYFKSYVAGKTLLLHVRPSEGSPLIQYGDLYDNGQNVRDILRAVFGTAVAAWPPPRELPPDSREIVQVVYTEGSIIRVQLDSDAPLLESLTCQIDEYVKTAPPFKPSQLAKGLCCIALSSAHAEWYRAKIINVSGDSVTVFYVDYGNEETIPATSVRSIIDNTVTKLRAQAIRCILNNYDKEITTKELRESLEGEILSKPVAMVVTQITPVGPLVDLYDSDVDPMVVSIVQRLKRASAVNGNVDPRSESYNDGSINSTRSNINRSDDRINKWNSPPSSEPPRIPVPSNSTERGQSNNRKDEENEPRRYDNRYQNRDKEWSPNSGQQQNERYSRNDGKNDRFPREGSRYERNERYDRNDRSGDSNANNRGGRDNRDRGGRGGFSNGRYPSNNSRTERNGSAEKSWSDKDSDTSSRGSGRSGQRGNSGGRAGVGRGRREGGRAPNTRDNDGDSDRGSFKNARTNGASSRIRDSRRDFGDRNESKQIEAWASKTPPIAKKVSIPLPNITVGAVKNCELVFVTNPTDFHVQLTPDNLELDPVMASIATIYENDGKILERSSIQQGIDCVAQYSEDAKWYRANVQSVETNGATVRFVDYGNVETVEFDKIKELDADCARLSAQAIACKLLAASKTTWDADDLDKFARLTDEKCLEAEFVANDNNVFEILLREVIDDKPSDTYINEEFSDGADLTRAKNNARSKGRQRQGQIVAPTDYAPIDEKWPVEDINPGTKQSIIITWFTNPDTFYCQTLSRKDEFRAMMNEMQQVYAVRQPINEPLQVGSPVMAVFSDDGALYRAEILELNKARGNIVRYVDFGNTAMVEQRNTYRVERKFMKLPKQAVNCSLKNIVPANGTSWVRSSKQEIEKCFEAESFECTFHEVKDGKYIISLRNGEVEVAGLLVEKSLASFAVSAHVHVEKNVEAPEKPRLEDLPRFDISLLAGQALRVKISNVGSAAKFHVQLPSANASEKLIDAYMAQNDPKVMPRLSCREVCLGAGCLVNTDEGWRRAVVVNCSRTTGFDVRLIDTGANDEIPLDSMLALPGQLSVMQNQAVECCLKNAKTNIVLDEKLRDRIENMTVIVAVEEVDNNRLIVKLYDTNGKSIKLTGDEEDEEICPVCPMPILYSSQTVAVSHAVHSSSVWLKRKVDLDVDTELLSQLFDYYSLPRDNDKKPLAIPGNLCAAKSADENWYRSKILHTTETGVMVQYIDYGNNEDIPLENLRVLETQFYAQPQLAIEVALTVTLGGSMEQQREILNAHIVDQEFTATLYNVRKKWVAELTNSEGKISEKLSALEAVDISKNPHVQAVIPEMVVGERYKVTCHHADSPASFWLQRNEEIPAIAQLQEKLQIDATSCPALEGIPEENTLCLAMYSVDDEWYRAEVIIADPEITSVRFIDFGNTDVVYTNQGKSKQITDSLKSIKRYAIKCRLDVIPYGSEDWMTSALEWFEATVTSVENMEALVIADSSPRRVELFADGISLVDELVKRNFAVRIDTEEDLIEEIVEREVDPRAAYVSHAISPNEFWIQQEKYVGDLEILADRFIVADMFPKPKEIKEGLLCVAKFPEDESWYRARVLSHADTGTEVIYIDYGNSAVSTEIREIPEDVAAQPAFSKKCRLAMPEGVEQWSEEACVEFVKMAAEGATIFQLDVLEEREDTSIVRLTQQGKDIVENLTVLCTTSVPVIEERLPPLGEENSPNVVVSHVNSPSDFSIQAESSINELEVMVDHLATAESFLPLEKIDEGMICAAKFPEDDQWYRAKVLSHGDAGTEVLYIDYGNSAVTTELRVLPEDIVKKPTLSTCCSLRVPDDIETWSSEACEKFFELVNEGITMFQYEILADTEQTVVVRLSIDGRDIVEDLSPLCAKKPIEESTNLERDETTRSNDENATREETLGNVVDDPSSLESVRDYTETSIPDRKTIGVEETSGIETSDIRVVTISDNSTLGSSLKCKTWTESSEVLVSETENQEEVISETAASIVAIEEVTEASNVDKVLEEVANVDKISEEAFKDVEDVSSVEKIAEDVSSVEKVAEEVSSVEKIVEDVSSVDKIAEDVSSVEKVAEEVSSVEKVAEEVSSVEKLAEDVSSVEKVAEEVSSVDKVAEEVSSVKKVHEEVSDTEKITEKLVKIVTIENDDEKVPESKEFIQESNEQETEIVDKDLKRSKTPIMEEILPSNISRGLSEEKVIFDQIERRDSVCLEDKIVPGGITKGKDLTIEDSTSVQSSQKVSGEKSVNTETNNNSFPVVARKLSYDEKILPGSVSRGDSPINELKCPTTPKIPHSEKIVAGVVSLRERLEDFEKDEILTVVTDENIPK